MVPFKGTYYNLKAALFALPNCRSPATNTKEICFERSLTQFPVYFGIRDGRSPG